MDLTKLNTTAVRKSQQIQKTNTPSIQYSRPNKVNFHNTDIVTMFKVFFYTPNANLLKQVFSKLE